MTEVLPKLIFGLLPALFYLGTLVLLDSYKLVPLRSVLAALLAGCLAVVVCRYLNSSLLGLLPLEPASFTRYVAPLTEETAKAAYVAFLIRGRRVGFLVDAAILGFAVGAGFGVLENVFYLRLIPDAGLLTWVLRGCGTALMHGSTTAIFALLAHRHSDRESGLSWRHVAASLLVAALLHSLYNHFLVSPVLTAAGLLGGIPLITVMVFRLGERSLEQWLGTSFDSDAELFAAVQAGELAGTRVGEYLLSLRDRFPPAVVADMLCLVRLHAELGVQAKALLMMRREGFGAKPPADAAARLAEMRYLEKSIGQTGLLALRPFLQGRRRTRWQRQLLER